MRTEMGKDGKGTASRSVLPAKLFAHRHREVMEFAAYQSRVHGIRVNFQDALDKLIVRGLKASKRKQAGSEPTSPAVPVCSVNGRSGHSHR